MITVIIIGRYVLTIARYIWCIIPRMNDFGTARRPLGSPPRGISQSDVSRAADSLLRAGMRPTIEKIRQNLGRGSPNTINPMLDAWWKTLSARLDSGPEALHRLPESIAHIAEALWMQALEEGKRRATLEQRDTTRLAELDQQRLELRSHVLTLREGELDSRLSDRDRTIEDLNLRLRELTVSLRKEQATHEVLSGRLAELESARVIPQNWRPSARHNKTKLSKRKAPARKTSQAGKRKLQQIKLKRRPRAT